MIEENELPQGWVSTKLGDITTIVGGSTPSRSEKHYFGGSIVWLTPTEIPKETVSIITSSKETLTEEGFRSCSVQLIPTGSVLLTSRASIGYVAIAGVPVTTNQGFASFKLPASLEPKYLGWWLKSQKTVLEKLAGGTTFKEISKTTLRDLSMPLAPLSEQQRIVEAIEQQFSRLDEGVALLRQAQKKLKLYRASVLKAAVEGKLTADWRASHPDTEPASELLKCILAERRAKWEEEQVAKGKDPKKVKYEESVGPYVSGLPNLPEGWCWITLGQIAWSVKDGPHYSPKYSDDGVPFITGGNVRPTGVDFINAKRISPELHAELSKRCKPEKRDILYTKGGTTGIARVNTYDIDFNVWVHVAVLKLVKSIEPFYVQHALNSELCYPQAQKFTHGVGNQDLGLTRMINIVLPLPSLPEQEQIISLIEERLSIISELETTIDKALKQAERQRQSILHKAFTGKLVPQNHDDEPASVLLERIQQERQQQAAQKQPAKATRGKKVASSSRVARVPEGPVEPVDPGSVMQGSLWEEQEEMKGMEKEEVVQGDLWQNVEA